MSDYVYEFVDKPETKLLILYILHQSKHVASCPHLPKQVLADFITKNINANYFVVQQCILELCRDNYISQFVENHKDCLEMQDKGLEALQNFFKEIPSSVMNIVDKAIYDEIREFKDNENIVVDYWKESEGCYTARIKIYEDDKVALNFSLSLHNEKDAQTLAKKFKEKPLEVYQKLIALSAQLIDEDKNE